MPINFRVKNKNVWKWNPYNGEITQLFHYSNSENGMKLPIDLAPWESTIIIFEDGDNYPHVTETSFNKVLTVSDKNISVEAHQNGSYFINVARGTEENYVKKEIYDLPSPLVIDGNWNMILESDHFKKVEKELNYLSSWTDDVETRNFSGTGKYTIQFQLPNNYINSDLKLELDLGKIGNIGEVFINGKNAGTVWMKGQRCDITNLVKNGNNELTIFVTNTNINRVSSFNKIVPVPDNLVDRFGEAIKGTRIPREFGFEPLPPSGLMGPVKIIPIKLIEVECFGGR